MTKSSRTGNGPRCDAGQLSAFALYTALNWLFSEWLEDENHRNDFIVGALKKNGILSQKECSEAEKIQLADYICAKLTEAAESCKTENAPEDFLRLFIEKIITDGYSFDIFLCYNDLPVVPYRFHYEPEKYEPLERAILGEAEIPADGIQHYHPEPGERHHKKEMKIRIMV